MTSVERRLEGLTADLTARERAILVMQAWLREETFDTNLRDRIPPEQKAEYDRIVDAIEDANRQIHSQLVIEQLWLYEVEIRLGWLQSLSAVTRRADHLEAELKRRGVRVRRSGRDARTRSNAVVLEPLPLCERGLEWSMRQFWGKSIGEPEGAPAGEVLLKVLTRTVALGLKVRTQDLRAWRVVIGEMRQAFDGYNVLHPSVEADLVLLEEQIEKLAAEARQFVDVELSLPTEEMVGVAREYIRLDDIRGGASPNPAPGQQWESDYAKKQREEANAGARAQLEAERARRDGELEERDVFTPGAEH